MTQSYTVLSTVAALARGLSEHCDTSKEELGDALKQKQRQRPKMQPQSHEVRGEVDEYERKEQRLAKERKCMATLRNDHTHRS